LRTPIPWQWESTHITHLHYVVYATHSITSIKNRNIAVQSLRCLWCLILFLLLLFSIHLQQSHTFSRCVVVRQTARNITYFFHFMIIVIIIWKCLGYTKLLWRSQECIVRIIQDGYISTVNTIFLKNYECFCKPEWSQECILSFQLIDWE